MLQDIRHNLLRFSLIVVLSTNERHDTPDHRDMLKWNKCRW